MALYNLDKVLADTEKVLTYHHPAFDITDGEREIARSHAKGMLALIAECRSNAKEFVQLMMSLAGTAELLGETLIHTNDAEDEPSEFTENTEFDRQAEEESYEEIYENYAIARRQLQIRQAVNVACLVLIEERKTILGKILDLRRRIAAFMPWNREENEESKPITLTVAVPEGMNVDTAIMLATSENLCEGGGSADVQSGKAFLFLKPDVKVEDVRTLLENLGFTLIGE